MKIEQNYTEEELDILRECCQKYNLPYKKVIKLIEDEASFFDMGRRRGLFPSLRRTLEAIVDWREEGGFKDVFEDGRDN